jgi:hypothetical protein
MADRQNAPQVLANVIVRSQWDADLHVLPASPTPGVENSLKLYIQKLKYVEF